MEATCFFKYEMSLVCLDAFMYERKTKKPKISVGRFTLNMVAQTAGAFFRGCVVLGLDVQLRSWMSWV